MRGWAQCDGVLTSVAVPEACEQLLCDVVVGASKQRARQQLRRQLQGCHTSHGRFMLAVDIMSVSPSLLSLSLSLSLLPQQQQRRQSCVASRQNAATAAAATWVSQLAS